MECAQDGKRAVFKSGKDAYFVDVGKRYKGTFRAREEAEKEVRKILQERCVEIKRKVLLY